MDSYRVNPPLSLALEFGNKKTALVLERAGADRTLGWQLAESAKVARQQRKEKYKRRLLLVRKAFLCLAQLLALYVFRGASWRRTLVMVSVCLLPATIRASSPYFAWLGWLVWAVLLILHV